VRGEFDARLLTVGGSGCSPRPGGSGCSPRPGERLLADGRKKVLARRRERLFAESQDDSPKK
jgi:hypothetical protein